MRFSAAIRFRGLSFSVPTIVCAAALAIAQLADVLVGLVDMLHALACFDRRIAIRMPSCYKAAPDRFELCITDSGVHAQFLVGLPGIHGDRVLVRKFPLRTARLRGKPILSSCQ